MIRKENGTQYTAVQFLELSYIIEGATEKVHKCYTPSAI